MWCNKGGDRRQPTTTSLRRHGDVITMTSSSDRNQYGEPTVVGSSRRDGVDDGPRRQRVALDHLPVVFVPLRRPPGAGTPLVALRRPPAEPSGQRSVPGDDQTVAVVDVDVQVGEVELSPAVDDDLDDLSRRVGRIVADLVDERTCTVVS